MKTYMASTVVTIYRNGDNHYSGKKVVVNRKQIRNFENFLDRVTRDTQAGCAVRSIRTPNHGSKVSSLEKLENGGIYVAVGVEKFKQLKYTEIPTSRYHFLQNQDQRREVTVKSRIYASARYRKVAVAEPLKNRIIHVFKNGEHKIRPIRLLLDKWILQNMDTVLQHITYKIKLRTGAVKSLYTCDGVLINDVAEIETGQVYVAVGYGKPFMRVAYKELGIFSITPRKANQTSDYSSLETSPKHAYQKKKINLKHNQKPKSMEQEDGSSSEDSKYLALFEKHSKKETRKGKEINDISSDKNDQKTSTNNILNDKNDSKINQHLSQISNHHTSNQIKTLSMEDEPSLKKEMLLHNIDEDINNGTNEENVEKSEKDIDSDFEKEDIFGKKNLDHKRRKSRKLSKKLSKRESGLSDEVDKIEETYKRLREKLEKKNDDDFGDDENHIESYSGSKVDQKSHKIVSNSSDFNQYNTLEQDKLSQSSPKKSKIRTDSKRSKVVKSESNREAYIGSITDDNEGSDLNTVYKGVFEDNGKEEIDKLNTSNTYVKINDEKNLFNLEKEKERNSPDHVDSKIQNSTYIHEELQPKHGIDIEKKYTTLTEENSTLLHNTSEKKIDTNTTIDDIDTADVEENDKLTESSSIFNATGKQKEMAKPIKDNNETQVEKTIDMITAEEIDDEEIVEDNEKDTNMSYTIENTSKQKQIQIQDTNK